jgi:hypothetical protein
VYRKLVTKLAADLDPIDLASAALKIVHERGGGPGPSLASSPDRSLTPPADAPPTMRSRDTAASRPREAASTPRPRTFASPSRGEKPTPRQRTVVFSPHDAAPPPRSRPPASAPRDTAPTPRPRDTTARSTRPPAAPVAAPPMNRRERRAAARAVLAALAAPLDAAPPAAAPASPAPTPAPRAAGAPARRVTIRKPRGPAASVVQLRIDLGSQAGLRPADVVGAIANEAGLTARQIGAITIAERSTTVEVPASEADAVVRALARTTIRGRRATNPRVT